MKARAPGKLVISGAYSVLRGAPALVTAVDRYVTADDSSPAHFETKEVSAALQLLGKGGPHPSFSADALRQDGRKLGLGSSAAICAASVALLTATDEAPAGRENRRLGISIYELTLAAHRQAQGGGSGIDVAAACFGGTLAAHLEMVDGTPQLTAVPVELPKGLVLETWAAPVAASTSDFVRRVFSLEGTDRGRFAELLGAQTRASSAAVTAVDNGSAADFVAALADQLTALTELGDAADVPIVLPELRPLCSAVPSDACFIPSGAGGGDVMLYVSGRPSALPFRRQAHALGLELVPLRVGARGVHFVDD